MFGDVRPERKKSIATDHMRVPSPMRPADWPVQTRFAYKLNSWHRNILEFYVFISLCESWRSITSSRRTTCWPWLWRRARRTATMWQCWSGSTSRTGRRSSSLSATRTTLSRRTACSWRYSKGRGRCSPPPAAPSDSPTLVGPHGQFASFANLLLSPSHLSDSTLRGFAKFIFFKNSKLNWIEITPPTHPIQTFFGNPSLTWTEHSNHNE